LLFSLTTLPSTFSTLAGNLIVKVVPFPTSLVTSIVPPCRSTIP
jgi:hypothetical protein